MLINLANYAAVSYLQFKIIGLLFSRSAFTTPRSAIPAAVAGRLLVVSSCVVGDVMLNLPKLVLTRLPVAIMSLDGHLTSYNDNVRYS